MSCPVITCTPARLVASVRPPAVVVAKLTAGQGPSGPPGVPGGTYTHTQSLAALVWTVNHNLGYRPAVSPLSVGGVEMSAEVIHVTVNQALVYFDSPTAGLAICS